MRNQDVEKTKEFCARSDRGWPKDAADWNQLCRAAEGKLSLTRAIKIFRTALYTCPSDHNMALHLASGLQRLGAIAEAEALVREVLCETPENRWATLTSGWIAQRKDDWLGAKPIWLDIIDRYPEEIWPIRQLATCYQNLGDLRQAQQTYETIVAQAEHRPIDRYRLACLTALNDGQELTLKRSHKFTTEYPRDSEIAASHAGLIARWGDPLEAIGLIRSTRQRDLDTTAPLDLQFAQVNEGLRNYRPAYDTYVAFYREQPARLDSLVCAARCLAKEGDFDAALDLIDSAGDGEECDILLRTRSAVFQLAGDKRAAVRDAIHAVRLCANVDNIAQLCLLLLDIGKLESARHVARELEALHGDNAPGWRRLAEIAERKKDARASVTWVERYLRSQPAHFETIVLLADGLWQIGDNERAWHAALALATNRPALLSPLDNVRKSEFAALTRDVATSQTMLTASAGGKQYLEAAHRLGRLGARPYYLKTYGPPDARIGRILNDLTIREEMGEWDEAARLIDRHADKLVARTAVPRRCGSLLYRAAQIYERVGRPGAALKCLERANAMSKADPVLLASYRARLRARSPSAFVDGEPRVAILVLTCEKNAHRSDGLARAILDQTSRTVFTLKGNPHADLTAIRKTPFGYELVVPAPDDYSSLTRKLMLAYRYLVACTNISGVLKIDDDIAIENFAKFEAMIADCADSGRGYVGSITRFANSIYDHARAAGAHSSIQGADHRPIEYCCGGSGYYLSRDSLEKIFELGLTYFPTEGRQFRYEDVFFGEVLATAGVNPTHMDMPIAGGYVTDVFEPLSVLAAQSAWQER